MSNLENRNQEQDETTQLDHLMELKKKRDEYMVEIRRKKREHTLTKKKKHGPFKRSEA